MVLLLGRKLHAPSCGWWGCGRMPEIWSLRP